MPRLAACALLLLGTLLVAPVVRATELEDVLEGFEEEDEAFAMEAPAEGEDLAPADRTWELTGSFSLETAVNYIDHDSATGTDYTGVQKLRGKVDLQLDFDLPLNWKGRFEAYGFYDAAYRIQGRDDYTDEVITEYEWEIDSQEMWFQGEVLEYLDLKIGRQSLNWGRSETLRVLDILNPIDNREPALADIEDLRLPVTMVRADYYWRPWSLTVVALPEIRFDRRPPVGSDFNPFAVVPPQKKPSATFENTEWAAAVTGVFEGWDVSLHLARYWNDIPYVTASDTSPTGLVEKHSRVFLAGVGGNYTIGSWLLKAELAYLDGLDFPIVERVQDTPGGPVPIVGTRERGRLDVLGGLEYYGIAETTISFDIVNRHITDFDRRMTAFDAEENFLESALRISSDFFNDRLRTTILGIMFGEHAQDGSIVRVQADYDLRDALVLTGGLVLYQNGDPEIFGDIGDNDRLFFRIEYSF